MTETRTVGCNVKSYATDRGWVASCSCGWRCCRTDRDHRDTDTAAHLQPKGTR